MTFPEILAAIDERLAAEPRLAGAQRESSADGSTWTRNRESVAITTSGSTGLLVLYLSDGKIVRRKGFARSSMSVERIVTSSAEHLTGYAFHRTPATG
jgi:hypothetical protein